MSFLFEHSPWLRLFLQRPLFHGRPRSPPPRPPPPSSTYAPAIPLTVQDSDEHVYLSRVCPPLARSNSFFGTIRNIVTAPFTWFAGSEDEFEDAKGKRRRLPVAQEDAHMDDESLPSRAKRMRFSSPDRDTQPYLDPPGYAFIQLGVHQTTPRLALSAISPGLLGKRYIFHQPRISYDVTDAPYPPFPAFSSRIPAAPSITDLQSEPNHARSSTSAARDVSMSPRRLRVRSPLTPQPSGTGFGPVVPPRRERAPDEPPPLASLMSNPMFVKPPPGAQKQGTAELSKQLTLGTLIDSQRSARAPARQSSILFGTGSMTDVSAPGHIWPVNRAEVALHELEVYKTPLLPTRFKGATAVPDMFLHREKKAITLMTDDRPVKPRLGTKSKGKRKERERERERGTINGTKPYAGEGGMKKWLARRKKEEEEETERERAEAMEDERGEEKKRKEAEAEQMKREEELKVPSPPPVPVFEPRASLKDLYFSAAFEDEDEEMEEPRAAEQKVLEEAAKKVPVFELPAGFTLAKETTIAHDLAHAKEPPITSLPFSLTKPAPAPAPPVAETSKVAPTPVPPIQAPAPPTISLVPPTPESVKVAPLPPTAAPALSAATSSGIPNFFTNSSVFAKPAPITTLPSAPTVAAVEQPKPAEVSEPSAAKAASTTPFLFNAPSRPPDSATPLSTVGAPSTVPKEAEKPTTPTPSLAPPFTFGAPAKPIEPTPTLPPKQPPAAEPGKPAAPSNGAPFTFGAPPSLLPRPRLRSRLPLHPPLVPKHQRVSSPLQLMHPNPYLTHHLRLRFRSDSAPAGAPAEEKPATTPFSFGTAATVEKKPTTGFTFAPSTASTAPPAAHLHSPLLLPPMEPPRQMSLVNLSRLGQLCLLDLPHLQKLCKSKAPERPTLNFSFATPSGSALFAQSPATTSAPFSFGGPGATLNPFAKEEKETKPTVSFGSFGQATSTGFAFGQQPPESPATTGPAAFQFAQPSPSVAPVSPFTFGPAPASATGFGQPSVASAPSSPSFNRPGSSFTFGTPTTTQPGTTPFGFGTGSQPASPATGNTTLPPATTGSTPFTFGAGANGAAPPAAGFGAPAPAAVFTIGSAPLPAEGAGGRRIKGLPRRGARR
ncbi:hypothetical protein JVT61DRAFT_11680 [Boletus reticuloceps]|uniref:Uncharacterized protein n=1 Tax=Boletus reticuloceps TaxID=495285 RepID=A0A8I2YXY6_9AGAM|nr:hypothetical protein JVT61DRAFT_11680 [Boletus reticuloceps]